jgi:hypothetical protein
MRTAVLRAIPLLALLPPVALVARRSGEQRVWQADIRIRTLEVTRTRTGVTARIVVYTENDDVARDARLLVLLPVGVGLAHVPAECRASPGPSMVPALRAAVSCEMGAIPNRGFHEVLVTTTLPGEPRPTRFAAFTYSGTPDPVPGNNYAERMTP